MQCPEPSATGFAATTPSGVIRPAYDAGAPQTSSVRPWMTLTYVAAAYHVQHAALTRRPGLSPGPDSSTRLKVLADRERISHSAQIERFQRVIPDIQCLMPTEAGFATGWTSAHCAPSTTSRCRWLAVSAAETIHDAHAQTAPPVVIAGRAITGAATPELIDIIMTFR
ncbi:hypothetical protein DM992_39755 (plasmid) [Burkholderia sp. JP2-270]|nr:hypothetical protein DM992_39755 [Burkholderia sp. JP2-270]